ncbi:MAG: fasciclin domain-containing protein [Alphaproteobacteria bacterium]|nr:fasciclin domain-containing protein [Alphaproteobacteria bacterium]
MNLLSRKSALAAALAATLFAPAAAQARNLELESSMQRLGDISDFYHAMIYTGIANELDANKSYTVFAPTNAALVLLNNNDTSSCPDQMQCRDKAAAFIRGHIVEGYDTTPVMIRRVQLQTNAHTEIVAQEPFHNQYTVDGQDVLSETDTGHSVIYRVNGLLKGDRDSGTLQAVSYFITPVAVSQNTTTYVVPQQGPLNAQGNPTLLPGVNAETTTVRQTTVTTQTTDDWQ